MRMFALQHVFLLAAVASANPVKVLIDTDIGRDMDDSWALAFMLGRRDLFDIQLILTATFDTYGKAQIVAKNLDAVGRADIAIGIGKATPYNSSSKVPGCRVGPMYPWASSYNLSSYPGKLYSDGVAQMAATISATPDVVILELAPATNMLSLRKRFPSLDTSRVKFFSMGGAIRIGYRNRPFLEPEYNIFTDINAAKAVYKSSHSEDEDIRWGQFVNAPLDTSQSIQIHGAEYQLLLLAEKLGNKILRNLFDAYRVWCKCPSNFAVTLSECNMSYVGCFQNHSIALQPFSVDSCSSALFDVEPVLMAATSLVPNSGLPSLQDMLSMQNLILAVDDFALTVPSYSIWGIGFKGGALLSTATSWAPAKNSTQGGLDKFQDAFVTSLAVHDGNGRVHELLEPFGTARALEI
jgi:inosine-uridine nucleoside N-ribohydrolase